MNYETLISNYQPKNEQEVSDKAIIQDFIKAKGDLILTRASELAHMTSSSIILNESMSHMLMIHHNIYNTWTWTGGHADGEADLLSVALREAKEETGLKELKPLTTELCSLDILPVWGHEKRGRYVSAHLHLNTAFIFLADEGATLSLNEQETSGLAWIPLSEVAKHSQEPEIIKVYEKLLKQAVEFSKSCRGE